MKTYSAIKLILEIIEDNLDSNLSIEYLANEASISRVHLQRVFMMAFKIPLAKYIRLRKLSASLKTLAFYDYKVVDVANIYGFEHEKSYIRAFKREFNITPGQFKSKGAIIKTTPPFIMDDFIDTSDGILSKPDIVFIPEMYLIGDANAVTLEETLEKSPRVAKKFWENNRFKIKNAIDKNVYIGLTRMLNEKRDKSMYLSSLQVSNIKSVPDGLTADRLPPSEYLRLFYIGNHHPYDLNIHAIHEVLEAIDRYIQGNTKYLVEWVVYFERIDESKYDGTYCYLEWLTPISIKQ